MFSIFKKKKKHGVFKKQIVIVLNFFMTDLNNNYINM